MEYLRQYFDITVLYYNPNITEREEYEKRAAEQKRLIREMNEEADGDCKNRILAEEGRYDPERFFAAAKGLELVPEGGERCFKCYEIRLREAARIAREQGFDYFTTTLTISPLKMRTSSMRLETDWQKSTASPSFPRISRKRTDINALWSFQKNTDYTARTTADVFFKGGA